MYTAAPLASSQNKRSGRSLSWSVALNAVLGLACIAVVVYYVAYHDVRVRVYVLGAFCFVFFFFFFFLLVCFPRRFSYLIGCVVAPSAVAYF